MDPKVSVDDIPHHPRICVRFSDSDDIKATYIILVDEPLEVILRVRIDE